MLVFLFDRANGKWQTGNGKKTFAPARAPAGGITTDISSENNKAGFEMIDTPHKKHSILNQASARSSAGKSMSHSSGWPSNLLHFID